MMKLMWIDGKPMWIPVTEQEDAERVAMLEAVRNIPEIMPEKIADNGGYIGKHGDNVSVYDAMMAEIMDEKDARLRKYLRKHELRNDNHPVRKEKRKAYVKEKCYSCDPWHGWDTVRKFREIEAEKADARDYEIELRNIADDAEQMKIEAEYAEWERRYRHEKYMRNLNEWLKYA